MNNVTASFKKTVRQMTKMSQQKKQLPSPDRYVFIHFLKRVQAIISTWHLIVSGTCHMS